MKYIKALLALGLSCIGCSSTTDQEPTYDPGVSVTLDAVGPAVTPSVTYATVYLYPYADSTESEGLEWIAANNDGSANCSTGVHFGCLNDYASLGSNVWIPGTIETGGLIRREKMVVPSLPIAIFDRGFKTIKGVARVDFEMYGRAYSGTGCAGIRYEVTPTLYYATRNNVPPLCWTAAHQWDGVASMQKFSFSQNPAKHVAWSKSDFASSTEVWLEDMPFSQVTALGIGSYHLAVLVWY